MLHTIQAFIITLTITAFTFAGSKIFITEITDPQNSSTAGRYLELYSSDPEDTPFPTRDGGMALVRWTNANTDYTASSFKYLAPDDTSAYNGIPAYGFYIVCNDADKFAATWPDLTCDQDIGTGGAADSNGDDNIALVDAMEEGDTVFIEILDMFGVAGEDGSGTGHEFEDGRAERAEGVTEGTPQWNEAEWNIDNDSGGGDGNQYAPEGFDPGAWIGAGSHSDFCEDETACNTGSDGACEYPNTGYDCDGNCVGEVDCAGVCGGDTVVDCAGECGGDAVTDDCGQCGGDGSSCSVSVTFSVDMSVEGVLGDIKLRTSTINGEYNPSDWHVMTGDENGTYSHTLSLLTGVEYGYNFNNSDGSGYESGDGLGDCAGGNYGNDRFVTPGDSDMTLDTVCWGSCEACPEDIPGCMDETALNYDENATVDDGSCIYDWPETANLFFSEYAEGSSNNKYLEIFNGSEEDVDLSGYSLSSCSNGCDDGMSFDYPDNVEFETGTTVSAGDVYVVCHGSADDLIQAECDQTFTYLSNGDDVFALTQVGSGLTVDIIGLIGEDPGSGWDVAGVSNATKDHTLVRKDYVDSGNPLWVSNEDTGEAGSSGTDANNSEWEVYDQNSWDHIGFHNWNPFDGPYCATDCEGVYDVSPDADPEGFCLWFNEMGGDEADCLADCVGTELQEIEYVAEKCEEDDESCALPGDMNGDGNLNVLDIVVMVGWIVEGDDGVPDSELVCADLNGDGELNVLDIVALVSDIVGGRFDDATSAKLIKSENGLNLQADGYVGGVQMTLQHGADFSIELSNNAWISDYVTSGNQTVLVLVEPTNGELFTTSDDFEIVDMIIANSHDAINTMVVGKFALSDAYPNPFNPSTTVELSVPEAGHVSVMVYNLAGQLVAKLADANMNADNYQFTWNADSAPSGMYLIQAEYAGQVSTQKLMLLK